MSDHILDKVFSVIEDRKGGHPEKSYVASLYHKGTSHIASKIMEEAEETIVEAQDKNAVNLAEESADLIFHLMVLWADQGVIPNDVYAVLEKRFGIGGHVEKAQRKS